MYKSMEAESSQKNCESIICRNGASSQQLLVDEALCDDNSAVSLPQQTMQKLHLSHGHPFLIKGKKKGRQAVSVAMAYDTFESDIEPKIRLNRDVMNDLYVSIGDFASLHCPDDAERNKPLQILSTDDNNLKDNEFLNNLPDNMLFEIFLRLPSCRSVVQYSSVNKRWSSIISNSAFIRSFIHHQDYKMPPFSDKYYCSRPFTLLFARYDQSFIRARADDMDDDPITLSLSVKYFLRNQRLSMEKFRLII